MTWAKLRTRRSTDHRLRPQVIFCVRGVISPLLANLYFRRFLLAWNSHGHRDRLGAHVVNYADDFVICCRPGNGEAALATMRHLMTRLGLTVNEAKTRLIRIPDGSCDFLGYTIGRFHGRDGGAYIGTRPSRKAVRALLRKIHDATTPQKHADTPGSPRSAACCAAGQGTSTKALSPGSTRRRAGIPSGAFDAG